MTYTTEYESKVILVTGGAGLIGTNLVNQLLKLNPEKIFILDDLSGAVRWNVVEDPKVKFVEGSVTDDQKLKRIFTEKPDFVFHLAAHFANQLAVEFPEKNLEVNGLGMMKVLRYSYLADVERFVFTSSGCATYGSKAPIPLVEDFVTMHLDTPYQIHKFLGELYCNFFTDYWGLPTVRTRLFNVYGPHGIPGSYKNVIPKFMFWAKQFKPLTITGEGSETRDYTYVGDIVDGLLRAGVYKEAVGEAINLGSGVETATLELASLINEITDNPAKIVFKPKRTWDASTRRVASIEKAKNLLDYNPQTSLIIGLKHTNEWFDENWDKIQRDALF
ncbi:MAG: NAD-dependent epimerase/dehydratase family protein [Candidatus Odinarchaeia archaeon]